MTDLDQTRVLPRGAWMRQIAQSVAVLLALAIPAGAQDSYAVLPGFSVDLDQVCGLGTDLQAGCDAIRAREILDAAGSPWYAIGRVNFATVEARRHCTGTLVASDVVLTAAHCLRGDGDTVVAPAAVTFVAGYQRGETVAAARAARFVLGPREAVARPSDDWALIVLEAPVPDAISPLPLKEDAEEAVSLAGYAGLRPHVLSRAACEKTDKTRANLLVLSCAVMPGDSGAPILLEQDGVVSVVGVISSIAKADDALTALAVPVAAVTGALLDLRP